MDQVKQVNWFHRDIYMTVVNKTLKSVKYTYTHSLNIPLKNKTKIAKKSNNKKIKNKKK